MDSERLIANVRKLKEGGPDRDEAFRAVYEETSRTAMAVIRRYCDTKDDYEDLLQETFIRVYRSAGDLKDDEKALAWIRRIAANTAIRHNQKLQKQNQQTFSDMEDEEGNTPEFEDTKAEYDPEAVADRKAVSQIVAQVLDGLPIEQRTAMWMVYGQQVSIRELAAELGVSENTIKSRLYQGRNKLMARKDEFRRLGVELSTVSIALLIASAFEDTVYAAPFSSAEAAAAAKAAARAARDSRAVRPDGPAPEHTPRPERTDTAKDLIQKAKETAGEAAGKTKEAAGPALQKARALAGSAAAKGGAGKGLAALLSASAGVKAAIAAGAAAVVIGGAGIAAATHASGYMEPIEYKLEAYNDRAYGLKETVKTYFPDVAAEEAEKVLNSNTAWSDSYYLGLWDDSRTNLTPMCFADMATFDGSYGSDWKLSWKKVSAEKVSGDELEEIRKNYTFPMQADPNAQLEAIFGSHREEREELEEKLKDMKISEARKVTIELSVKGQKAEGKKEREAIVVKMGGDWILYKYGPEDLVFSMYFHPGSEARDEEPETGTTAETTAAPETEPEETQPETEETEEESEPETDAALAAVKEKNSEALAAYRDALENDERFQPSESGRALFSLVDVNGDGISEMYVYPAFTYDYEAVSYLLYHTDDGLHEEPMLQTFSYIPEEGAIATSYYQMGIQTWYFSYDGKELKKTGEDFYSSPGDTEYENADSATRADYDRAIAKSEEFNSRSKDVVTSEATEENIGSAFAAAEAGETAGTQGAGGGTAQGSGSAVITEGYYDQEGGEVYNGFDAYLGFVHIDFDDSVGKYDILNGNQRHGDHSYVDSIPANEWIHLDFEYKGMTGDTGEFYWDGKNTVILNFNGEGEKFYYLEGTPEWEEHCSENAAETQPAADRTTGEALSALRSALTSDERFQSPGTEFSLLDVNNDGAKELFIYVPGETSIEDKTYFLSYSDKLYVWLGYDGSVGYIPDEQKIVAFYGEPEYITEVYDYDGASLTQSEKFSYFASEYGSEAQQKEEAYYAKCVFPELVPVTEQDILRVFGG